MYHFFVEPSQINDKHIIITGDDVNHIKNVIRLKVGDEISISNGVDGREYRCGIAEISDSEVVCTLRFIKEEGVELPVKVFLFQGLPKGDKMEFIIQKMVELGVYEIIPVKALQRRLPSKAAVPLCRECMRLCVIRKLCYMQNIWRLNWFPTRWKKHWMGHLAWKVQGGLSTI